MNGENPPEDVSPREGGEYAVWTSRLGRRFGDLVAVEGVELQVGRGEIFGLVGPDGAGKTTVLRMLCGLLDPTEGEARVAGFDVSSQTVRIRDRIGYMAQRFGLYVDLTVKENMLFYADLFGLPSQKVKDLMPELLRMTRMEPFLDRKAGNLSGGMKQKLNLMCALLHEPEILFLDEPTNGVDPISRRDFWVILYRLVKSGLTVVVSTSYLDEAERCKRVGLMYGGRLLLSDSPDELGNRLADKALQVRSAQPRKARDVLESRKEVTTVVPAGAALHIFVSPEWAEVERVNQWLEEAGLSDFEVRDLDPSIEDLFIAMVRKEESREAEDVA